MNAHVSSSAPADADAARPVRVLLIEDEPADAKLVMRAVRSGGGVPYRVAHAAALADARPLLAEGVDVVLLDLSLPDSFGLATLTAVAALAPPQCPILVLTGHDDERLALDAVDRGAQDYLIKGQADGAQLRRAIQHAIRRKQLEERLRLSEERFKAVFTLAKDPILAADHDMRVVMFNRAAEETFGWRADEIIGRPLDLLAPGRHRDLLHREFARLMETPDASASGIGLSAMRRNGEEFTAEASISHVQVPEGVLLAATIRDVSEQRAAQQSLERQAAAMAALAERLDAALASAEQASKVKSEFLATMSHEIRNPLNGVLGMTRLLLDQPMPDDQREKLEIVNDSGEALLAILNDILDFSKLEAGRVELESADFDVGRVVRSTVGLMESRAQLKGVALLVTVAPSVPRMVRGDANRLRQILLNLVGNAVKFTEKGHVLVTVAAADAAAAAAAAAGHGGASGSGGPRLTFSVADTGIGIDPAVRQRLFKEFSQADSTVARRFGGTGLGLAICNRLAALMGGAVGVESRPGHGSRFWFSVPFGAAERDEPSVAASPAPSAAPATGLQVLLAEDNLVNQMVIRGFLDRRGHRVAVAENGLQAVEAVRTGGYDVVLMDVQMPVMDGMEATRLIRSLPAPAGAIPIVALTGSALAQDREACRAVGMNAFVSKPVTPEDLFAAVEAAAGATGRVAADAAPPETPAPPVLDRAVFDVLVQAVGDEMMERLLKQFVVDVRVRVERVVDACLNGDLAAARAASHDAKSMSATFGLSALSAAAAAVETACRGGDAAAARIAAPQLSRRLAEALPVLNAL